MISVCLNSISNDLLALLDEVESDTLRLLDLGS